MKRGRDLQWHGPPNNFFFLCAVNDCRYSAFVAADYHLRQRLPEASGVFVGTKHGGTKRLQAAYLCWCIVICNINHLTAAAGLVLLHEPLYVIELCWKQRCHLHRLP